MKSAEDTTSGADADREAVAPMPAPGGALRKLFASEYGRPAAIALVSLALNVAFVLLFVNTNRFPQLNSKQIGDSGYLIAVNLLEGNGYMQYFDDIKYQLWRPPTFPLFLAGLFSITGKSYLAMRLALCVFGAAAAVATFYAAKGSFGLRVGTIAGFAVALNPGTIFMSGLSGPESMCAFLSVVGFAVLPSLRSRPRWTLALLGGALAALNSMNKAFYVVWLVVAVAWLLLHAQKDRRLYRVAAIYLLGFALTVSPWVARNWVVTGQPRLASTDAALVLWGANVPSWLTTNAVENRWPPIEFHENFARLAAMDELTRDRWFVAEAKKSIAAHRVEYAKRVIGRIWTMWKPYPSQARYDDWPSMARVAIMLVTFTPLLFLFAAASWQLRREIRTYGIIHAFLLMVTLGTALAHSTGRYRTPLEPLMIIIAAVAAERYGTALLAWYRRRRQPTAAAT